MPTIVFIWLLIVGYQTRQQQSDVLAALSRIDDRLVRLEAKADTLATEMSKVDDEAKRLAAEERSALESLREGLGDVRAQASHVEELISGFTTQKQTVAELLEQNAIALGVRYKDTSGKQKLVWKGTGFPIKNSEWLVTAAHVVEQLNELRNDLDQRGLAPDVVAKSSNGTLWQLLDGKTHPDCPGESERHATAPTQFFSDVGLFKFADESARPVGLSIRLAEPLTKAGQEIAVGGFPTEVSSVDYLKTDEGETVPTIRFGRVERVSSLDTRVRVPVQLIQHNVPLVGGFSGAPIVNMDGEVIGVASVSSYRMISAEETVRSEFGIVKRNGNVRLLDAANVNFAVSAKLLDRWLHELSSESRASVGID